MDGWTRRRELLKVVVASAAMMGIGIPAVGAPSNRSSATLRLHPENPHYFLFRGQSAVLLTAGEHYGGVINLDFDYRRYLDELKRHRFNLTRIFSGTYREVPGSFNIVGNPLAPAPGRFVCPWPRSETGGAADGRDKFDLTKWDSAYFDRIKDFITEAGKRGVVVELVFFCTMYDDSVWNASPMNARNNVNGIGKVSRAGVYNANDEMLLNVQKALVRKLVTELNGFDNLYYEICNEPYERGGLTSEWNDAIIATVVETEASLPKRHLIAQGFPPSSGPISKPNRHVSVFNFHAAKPDSVRLNYSFNKAIAFDETGGSDQSDRKYRTEGWEFILAGGAVYDHLDFSFTPDHEDGTAVPLPEGTPGGGGPKLRRQLAILKEFIEGFDFIRMAPDERTLKEARINPPASKATVRVLSEFGKAYAIYVSGGTKAELVIDLPAGAFRAAWLNTKTGKVEQTDSFQHPGGQKTLTSPAYTEDIALRLRHE